MKPEVRLNFANIVKLINEAARSKYSNPNRINLKCIKSMRLVDSMCGKLGEVIDVIFKVCEDGTNDKGNEIKKEDIVFSVIDDYELRRCFNESRRLEVLELQYTYGIKLPYNEQKKRKTFNIIINFEYKDDDIVAFYVFLTRRDNTKEYEWLEGDEIRFIYDWKGKSWVGVNPEADFQEPPFKKIALK